LDEPWDSEHNKKLLDTYPKVFALPGSDDAMNKTTHYRVFTGKGAGFNQLQSCRMSDITDGTSNTLMVVTAATPVPWTKPDDLLFDTKAEMKKLLLFHNGVTQAGFFDGSVRALSEKLDEVTWKALITIGGGEVVNPDGK
jgi:prepilin-type processing-associated H-X9-DG protein